MKAVLQKGRPDGTYVTIGTEGQHVTKSYRSFATLYRYGILPYLRIWGGRLRAEIFLGESVFGTPHSTVTWNTQIYGTGE